MSTTRNDMEKSSEQNVSSDLPHSSFFAKPNIYTRKPLPAPFEPGNIYSAKKPPEKFVPTKPQRADEFDDFPHRKHGW